MSSYILQRDPSPQKIFIILLAAFAFVWIVLFSGCKAFNYYPDQIFIDPPDQTDTTALPVIDSVPLPLIDTCIVSGLIHLDDTAFVCLVVPFDEDIVMPVYKLYNKPQLFTDIVDLLETYWIQYDYTAYQTLNGICVFIDGTDNQVQFQGKIVVRGAFSHSYIKTAFSRYLSTRGVLTFDQFCYEADHRLNIKSVDFWNTDWTAEQYNIAARKVMRMDENKHGETLLDLSACTGIAETIPDSGECYLWLDVKRP